MALPTITNTFDYISQLSDLPNDTDGLTAAQLKAKFDQAGQELKTWINGTFAPAVESAIDAAAQGVPTGGRIDADQIRDLAIITAKIADLAVTTAKLADSAVTTDKINNGAVTVSKLDDDSVSYRKIIDKAVRTAKLDDGAVTETKIGDAAVSENKIGLYAVTTNKVADEAITSAKIDGTVQKRRATATVTLASGETSWVGVAATGVKSNNVVIVSPASTSHDEYNNCGVRCTAQGNGTLNFSSLAAPSSNLTVNVTILD